MWRTKGILAASLAALALFIALASFATEPAAAQLRRRTITPTPSGETPTPVSSATPGAAPAASCAFGKVPQTYEAAKDRLLYLQALELAGFNMIAPGNGFFGVDGIEAGLRYGRTWVPGFVPPTLLKAIGWMESVLTQASTSVSFQSTGPALVSFDCGHGIMQITTGMTAPLGESGRESREQALVAANFAYNIARGAAMLAEKWNAAPEYRPIAGADTNSDPGIMENWYYAVWSYNGFTGPGANRSNHPLDPIYGSWPRTPYSCGPAGDGLGHDRGRYPYQELVFGCASHPPVVDGRTLWSPTDISLPNLNDARWRTPLSLSNFVYPYGAMDMPSPWPYHTDPQLRPSDAQRGAVLGAPRLVVDPGNVFLRRDSGGSVAPVRITIRNTGTGLLSWRITTADSWITISDPVGVALGDNLPCAAGATCVRAPSVEISLDPLRTPQGGAWGKITVESMTTGEKIDIPVTALSSIKIGVPGVARQ